MEADGFETVTSCFHTATSSDNNNNISLLTSETNLLGAYNNQAGKVLTGEDEADNHEINVDRAIKGSCESSSLSHLSALGCTALIWFQRGFIIKK